MATLKTKQNYEGTDFYQFMTTQNETLNDVLKNSPHTKTEINFDENKYIKIEESPKQYFKLLLTYYPDTGSKGKGLTNRDNLITTFTHGFWHSRNDEHRQWISVRNNLKDIKLKSKSSLSVSDAKKAGAGAAALTAGGVVAAVYLTGTAIAVGPFAGFVIAGGVVGLIAFHLYKSKIIQKSIKYIIQSVKYISKEVAKKLLEAGAALAYIVKQSGKSIKNAVKAAAVANSKGVVQFAKYIGTSKKLSEKQKKKLDILKEKGVLWDEDPKENILALNQEEDDSDDDVEGTMSLTMAKARLYRPTGLTHQLNKGVKEYPNGIRLIRPSIEISNMEGLAGKTISVEWVKNDDTNKKQILKKLQNAISDKLKEYFDEKNTRKDLFNLFYNHILNKEDTKLKYDEIEQKIIDKNEELNTAKGDIENNKSQIKQLEKEIKEYETKKETYKRIHKLGVEEELIKNTNNNINFEWYKEKNEGFWNYNFDLYEKDSAKLNKYINDKFQSQIADLRNLNILFKRMSYAYPMICKSTDLVVYKNKKISNDVFSVYCFYTFDKVYKDLYDKNINDEGVEGDFKKEYGCLISKLLTFKFNVNRSNVLSSDERFNQFKVKFLNKINKLMLGDIYHKPDAVEFKIIRGKDTYIFNNNNELIRNFRDNVVKNFTNQLMNKIEKETLVDKTYDGNWNDKKSNIEKYKGYKILNDLQYIKTTKIYNLILRITAGLLFIMLHASNFADYDLLTISQFDHVMNKLFNIPEFKIDNENRRKPLNIIELLNIEKTYWESMCEDEVVSLNNAKIAFFKDTIEKGMKLNLYRNRKDPLDSPIGKLILDEEKVASMYGALDQEPSMISLANNKLNELYRGANKRVNYCAQIDDKFDFSKANITGNKQDNYIHKYDDVLAPHIAKPRTWSEIDNAGYRADMVGMGEKMEPSSPFRFILHQDLMNYIKYYVNTQLIPKYEYFDSFYDCFCSLALSLVETQGQEGEVPILNWKSFILMLEPYDIEKISVNEKDISEANELDGDSSDSEDSYSDDDDELELELEQKELEKENISKKEKILKDKIESDSDLKQEKISKFAKIANKMEKKTGEINKEKTNKKTLNTDDETETKIEQNETQKEIKSERKKIKKALDKYNNDLSNKKTSINNYLNKIINNKTNLLKDDCKIALTESFYMNKYDKFKLGLLQYTFNNSNTDAIREFGTITKMGINKKEKCLTKKEFLTPIFNEILPQVNPIEVRDTVKILKQCFDNNIFVTTLKLYVIRFIAESLLSQILYKKTKSFTQYVKNKTTLSNDEALIKKPFWKDVDWQKQNNGNKIGLKLLFDGKEFEGGIFTLNRKQLLVTQVPQTGNSFYFALLNALIYKLPFNVKTIPVKNYKLKDKIKGDTLTKIKTYLDGDYRKYINNQYNFENITQYNEMLDIGKGESYKDDIINEKVWNFILKTMCNLDIREKESEKLDNCIIEYNIESKEMKPNDESFEKRFDLALILRLITIMYLFECTEPEITDRMSLDRDLDLSRENHSLLQTQTSKTPDDKDKGKIGYIKNKLDNIKDIDDLMIAAISNILNLPIIIYITDNNNSNEIKETDDVKLFLPCNDKLDVIYDKSGFPSNIPINKEFYSTVESKDYLEKYAVVLTYDESNGLYSPTMPILKDIKKKNSILEEYIKVEAIEKRNEKNKQNTEQINIKDVEKQIEKQSIDFLKFFEKTSQEDQAKLVTDIDKFIKSENLLKKSKKTLENEFFDIFNADHYKDSKNEVIEILKGKKNLQELEPEINKLPDHLYTLLVELVKNLNKIDQEKEGIRVKKDRKDKEKVLTDRLNKMKKNTLEKYSSVFMSK